MAHHARSLPAFLRWYPRLREGALDLGLRYLAYVRASQLNRYGSCVTHNSAAGLRAGLSRQAGRAGHLGGQPIVLGSGAAGAALCGSHDPRRPSQADLVEGLRARLSAEALVQLTLSIAAANFANRFNEALGTELERPASPA